MSAYVRVAFVAHAKNLDGSVVCRKADGLPFRLSEGLTVYFVPPSLRGPRSAVVESLVPGGEGEWVVRFSGIASADAAQAIAGSYCLALAAGAPDAPAQDAPETLVGFAVEDEALGALGLVRRVSGSAAQAVLEVDGPQGEVLIPFVEEFVAVVDEEACIVRTRVPSGLVGLNAAQGGGPCA